MRKLSKLLFAGLLVLAMALIVLPGEQTYAKTTNKQAKATLAKKVKNKFCRYAYVDIDLDGIDELVVRGYSGKFVDGCDKKKSITIYKIVNGKAKAILSENINGDFFHPYINCGIYYLDAPYVFINKNHEGYFQQIVYKYSKNSFTEVANITLNADGTGEYRIGGKGKKTVEFEDYEVSEYEEFKDLFDDDYRIEQNYQTCTTKVANKYLKKMLTSEYKYRCKISYYGKKDTNTSFDDLDGDGISELIVTTGAKSGEVLYAYMSEDDDEYYTGAAQYSIVNGKVVYAED